MPILLSLLVYILASLADLVLQLTFFANRDHIPLFHLGLANTTPLGRLDDGIDTRLAHYVSAHIRGVLVFILILLVLLSLFGWSVVVSRVVGGGRGGCW